MSAPLAAAISHVGRIRTENQDSGYTGAHLSFVADGMGGHAGGDVASAIVTRKVREADVEYESAEQAAQALADALRAGNEALQQAMLEHPELSGMGTTASGIIRVGDRLGLAHIGDSRIYRYRVGALEQLSTDHTFVQRLVDAGRITREEAEHHPRRNVVMRVLGNIETDPEIDTWVEDALPGDRYLVCSDGLSSYVDEDRIRTILEQRLDTPSTVQRLVNESLSRGAPDNVTVVVVDIDERLPSSVEPTTVGSAAAPISFEAVEPERTSLSLSQLLLHPRQARMQPAFEHFEPESEEFLQELLAEQRRMRRNRRISWSIGAVLAIALAVTLSVMFYSWTQDRFFVGVNDAGQVAIYQGIQQQIGPFVLATEIERTDIELAELTPFNQRSIEQTISAESLADAQAIVERLERSP
ncbi:protein phosphatase 2C domain-containing protein [Agrococcus sp. Marseille-Q4369]|uniref:PP2C family protein-serine/threonine phosphatase n=1 Tax=Agrococcus sp. Marseille-Q4369 TaxID=2810513 RepID=UPI001B8D890A|nr:protein phosphatase 2C domain-containing protein [Agrococcus sp. Marseille-Q4369]QUW18016.1 serine/threonine-protein phosphatase [Agrococcus sp. Marseille-Q4369]